MTVRAQRVVVAAAIGAGVSIASGVYAWQQLGRQSALTTSYSTLVAHRQSLPLDVHDLVSGVLFFRRTAERLAAANATDHEKLTALMDWTHENVRPQYAAPSRVVGDTFIDIVRRGHGYCDQSAHVFATLAHFAGYEVHLLMLRRPDGVSPHTVAEVRVSGRWVIVDPWVGSLFLDRSGELAGVPDLGQTMDLPDGYTLVAGSIEPGHFRRGARFETFPYQPLSSFLGKAWRRVTGSRLTENRPAPPAPRPVFIAASQGGSPRAPAPSRVRPDPSVREVVDPEVLETALLRMDEARRAHLDARYPEAIAGYRELLAGRLPVDMGESVGFFLGLALLRAGSSSEAVRAFDAALDTSPETSWRLSILYYRGEARLQAGDAEGAAGDWFAASTPQARMRLTALAPP